MKIKEIQVGQISVPLKKPFKTAMRRVDRVEDIVIKVITDTGHIGYGEAPPTAVITGDTLGSIRCAIEEVIKPQIIGLDIENIEEIMKRIDSALIKNTSAKAAVDIAIYDLFGQLHKAPLYKLLGGYRKEIITDITISVNAPEEMAQDSIEAIQRGYKTLKIKVGKDSQLDMKRIKAIREAIGYDIQLRVDANQGWNPKEAVSIITKIEDKGFDIELVEQPVKAHDIEGLKYVTDNVKTPILAVLHPALIPASISVSISPIIQLCFKSMLYSSDRSNIIPGLGFLQSDFFLKSGQYLISTILQKGSSSLISLA